MYLYHFGLKELPFTLTPNTSYFFGLPTHKAAMQVLETACKSGEGFIKVTGEVGTGKTLLCRKLLNELQSYAQTAYIPNPMLSPAELRRAVASELQVELTADADQQEFTQRIQTRLIQLHQQQKPVVLIIDEAQALPVESIEALRLMTNLETESRKLLQVVLFGQPELDEKLGLPELRQLKQRITFSYALQMMDADQVFQYVQHRLKVAGLNSETLFSRSVAKRIFRASRGTPRVVNVLCHKALMLAFGEGKQKVSRQHVKLAASDTEAAGATENSWFGWTLAGVLVASLAVVGLHWQGVLLP